MVRLVIDSNCLCYKALFTMGGLSHAEQKVGVIFGFIRQVLALSHKFSSSNLIFCWDSKNSYRKIACPEYKAKRIKDRDQDEKVDMEDAFRQFDEIRELLLPTMGFKNIFQQNGYEADDLIAYITMRIPDDTIICSTDNDLLQLIHQDRFCPVKMYNFKAITDESAFRNAWFNLSPPKWAVVKALAGCTTDEVKGIVGVGELTAAKYLAGILKGRNLEKIDSEESKAIFNKNFPLVALPYSGIKPIRNIQLQLDDITIIKFKSIFQQYGFRSLLREEEVEKWSNSFF